MLLIFLFFFFSFSMSPISSLLPCEIFTLSFATQEKKTPPSLHDDHPERTCPPRRTLEGDGALGLVVMVVWIYLSLPWLSVSPEDWGGGGGGKEGREGKRGKKKKDVHAYDDVCSMRISISAFLSVFYPHRNLDPETRLLWYPI